MKRNIDIKEISDGKLYTANDMVKADCHDCEGCWDCCTGMGNSIVLDPMDIWRLTSNLEMDFQTLLEQYIELNVVDGLILPNLKLSGDKEACGFLNEKGRCSIHTFRPGICRLFPLGRFYEENGFKYFLQVHECPKTDRSKVKIKKWLGIPNLKAYEQYIIDWHNFKKQCEQALEELKEEHKKILILLVLKTFYQTAYSKDDFYGEFYKRLEYVRETVFGQ